MLSIIIPENKEGKEWVQKMVSQAENLDPNNIYFKDVEIIFATSMTTCEEFCNTYELNNSKIPITVIPNMQNGGAARTYGGIYAKGDSLLFLDAHVCYDSNNLDRLLKTLDQHPDSIVAPGYKWVEFPECTYTGATTLGVYYTFNNNPFQWTWLPVDWDIPTKKDKEYQVPFVCACIFSMKKSLFNIFLDYGGFLMTDCSKLKKLGMEEEVCMRLYRLGHPTYVEPRSVLGHYFKDQPNHRSTDGNIDQHRVQVVAAYVNIFNTEIWNMMESLARQKWKQGEWDSHIEFAKKYYQWLRDKMEPFKDKIDESYFFRKE